MSEQTIDPLRLEERCLNLGQCKHELAMRKVGL